MNITIAITREQQWWKATAYHSSAKIAHDLGATRQESVGYLLIKLVGQDINVTKIYVDTTDEYTNYYCGINGIDPENLT